MAKRERWSPLKEGYVDSKKVNRLSFAAETLFTRLIAKSDDNSNFDGDPVLLACKLYAERMKSRTICVSDVERMLQEIITERLVIPYEVDGEPYLHIWNCKKFVRADIKPDIRFPNIPQVVVDQWLTESETNPERIRDENVTNPERTRNVFVSSYNTIQDKSYNSAHTQGPQFSLEEVQNLAPTIGIPPDKAEMFFHHFNAQGWVRTNGQKITNLASALTYWRNNQYQFEDRNNGRNGKTGNPKDRVRGDFPVESEFGETIVV